MQSRVFIAKYNQPPQPGLHEDSSRKGFYQALGVRTFHQPAMAANRFVAIPNVKPACCCHVLQRFQRSPDARVRCASRILPSDVDQPVLVIGCSGRSPGPLRHSDAAHLPE